MRRAHWPWREHHAHQWMGCLVIRLALGLSSHFKWLKSRLTQTLPIEGNSIASAHTPLSCDCLWKWGSVLLGNSDIPVKKGLRNQCKCHGMISIHEYQHSWSSLKDKRRENTLQMEEGMSSEDTRAAVRDRSKLSGLNHKECHHSWNHNLKWEALLPRSQERV